MDTPRALHLQNVRFDNARVTPELSIPLGAWGEAVGSVAYSLFWDGVARLGRGEPFVRKVSSHRLQCSIVSRSLSCLLGFPTQSAWRDAAHSLFPRGSFGACVRVGDSLLYGVLQDGVPHCPQCGILMETHGMEQLSARPSGLAALSLSVPRSGYSIRELLEFYGGERCILRGRMYSQDDLEEAERDPSEDVSVVVRTVELPCARESLREIRHEIEILGGRGIKRCEVWFRSTSGKLFERRGELVQGYSCPACGGTAPLLTEHIAPGDVSSSQICLLGTSLETLTAGTGEDLHAVLNDSIAVSRSAWEGELQQRLALLEALHLSRIPLRQSVASLSSGERVRIVLLHLIDAGTSDILLLTEDLLSIFSLEERSALQVLLRQRFGERVSWMTLRDEPMVGADGSISLDWGAKHPQSSTTPTVRAVQCQASEWRGKSEAFGVKTRGEVILRPGEITLLTGASGSGKSRYLSGLSTLGGSCFGKPIWGGCEESIRRSDEFLGERTGLMKPIADLFAALPESRRSGFGADAFSPGTSPHRCGTCMGRGVFVVDQLWADTCPDCGGKMFVGPLRSVRYDGRTICDMLRLPLSELALIAAISSKAQAILAEAMQCQIGHLSAVTTGLEMSLGERRRAALAHLFCRVAESRRSRLLLLDAPRLGSGSEAWSKIVASLKKFAMAGHTVVLTDAIASSVPGAKVVECLEASPFVPSGVKS